MKIGDPKQAAILAIVAIVILCTAVIRVLPKAAKVVAGQATLSQPAAAQVPSQAKACGPLPKTLTTDPFSMKAGLVPASATQSPVENGKSLKHPPSSIKGRVSGSIPPVDPEPPGFSSAFGGERPAALPTITPLPGQISNPSENTGIDRNIKKEPSKALTLTGVMQMTRRIAIVTIDGNEDEPIQCQVGSVVEGYKVLNLTDSQLTLRKGKRTLLVSVGDKVDL